MTCRKKQQMMIVSSFVLGLFFMGCLNRDIAPNEPSTQTEVLEVIHQTGATKVDILFVIDNSYSMEQEQDILADQVRFLAGELVNPSNPSDPVVQDLHIGIVSTDYGTFGYNIPNSRCNNPTRGDNGVLQNTGLRSGCDSVYSASDCNRDECPWLTHNEENPDDGSDPSNPPIWEDFGCIASLGTNGCAFEQQLESSYAALVLQTGVDQPNEGFLREDSLLSIIYVTDEDDCSTDRAEMFDPSRDDLGLLNVRCALNPDKLNPIGKYHDAFVDLRDGDEDRIVVAVIGGIPIDGRWTPNDSLEDLRELQVIDPANPNQLIPTCDTGNGLAFPPVRLTEFVFSFGTNGIIESICRDDWSAALQAITRKIMDKLPGVCVERALASTSSDACRVIETLPDDRECPHVADNTGPDRTVGWQLDLGTITKDGQERRRCEILPADYDGNGCPDPLETCSGEEDSSTVQGWYYDNINSNCAFGQVRFTTTDVTSDNSTVRFECLTAMCPASRTCREYERPPEEGCHDSGLNCTPGSCGPGEVCVSHVSEEYCGWTYVTDVDGNQVVNNGRPVTRPCSCFRCSPTIGSVCNFGDNIPPEVTDIPLYGAGGCCAEGFHCENGSCEPDRTNSVCLTD